MRRGPEKRALLVVTVLLLAGVLTGCWSYGEPDEIAWVQAIGLDKGEQNRITVTFVVAVPKAIAGGGGGQPAQGGEGGAGTFQPISFEAETLLGARELLNSVMDRRVNLSHTRWIVFGRELAEEGISRYLAPLIRFREFRHSTTVIVAQGRAAELLEKGQPVLEDSASKYYDLMARGWRYTEFIPFTPFHLFYSKAKSPGYGGGIAALAALEKKEPVFPNASAKPKGVYYAGHLPRKGGGKIELIGAAVFKKGRMVGVLNGSEVGAMKMLSGTFRQTVVDVADPRSPQDFVIVEIHPRQPPQIDVSLRDDGTAEISAGVSLEGDVISIQSGVEYDNPENIHLAESLIERDLKRKMEKTVTKSQEMEVDIFGFGDHVKKKFATWPAWMEYNWPERFPDAVIRVRVDFKIRRIGLVHESFPVRG
ncbi:MAG: Ger(x)C family spore germination protein [Peptococcaceae bacterium]|nr:Ger(x)C family spore germination protein [Peptococcaceae bacterium]